MLFLTSASANETEDESLLKMISDNEEVAREILRQSSLPGPEEWEELKGDPNILAMWGTVPETEDGAEAFKRFMELKEIARAVSQDETLNE